MRRKTDHFTDHFTVHRHETIAAKILLFSFSFKKYKWFIFANYNMLCVYKEPNSINS